MTKYGDPTMSSNSDDQNAVYMQGYFCPVYFRPSPLAESFTPS